MMNPAETIEVQNVVASTAVGQELDLERLSQDLNGVSYDPDNFPGLVYRLEKPKAAALVFRSGKIVCTGANSPNNVHGALTLVFETLDTLGVEVPNDPVITIQNIVSSADLGHRLNLNAIAIGLGLERVEYEPEQFPGLVYRMSDPSVVVLLFGSGKLVITGGEILDDAIHAVENVHDQLDTLGLLD